MNDFSTRTKDNQVNPLETAFHELDAAARHWAANLGEVDAATRLTKAADAYARARWASKTGSKGRSDGKPTTSTLVLPFGRAKGKTLAAAPSGDLRWVAEKVTETLDDPDRERYRAKNVELVRAIEAELQSRGES